MTEGKDNNQIYIVKSEMDGPSRPSDNWPSYTDSLFSNRHIKPIDARIRTSTWILTAANLIKMYIGISFISVPKSVREAGIYGSVIGFIYVAVANIFSVYILLKARNRFKGIEIIDISDLSAVLYGNWSRPLLASLLILANGLFLLAYVMFFGVQSDQLVCKTFKKRDCGHEHEYSFIIVTILLPVLWLRRLRNVGFFSIFILCFTFSAICLIVYINIKIYSKSP
jgi:amino acid permease